ncbi:MAG: GNAT family N-acetyltransferase [Cyclobacteriaceae bacterium]
MNTVKIRPATPEDLPILFEFEQGIIDAERPMDPTLAEGHITYYDLAAYVQAEDTEVLLAEVDNEPIGSGYVQIREGKSYQKHERYGYIGFVFVRPEHRGKGVVSVIMSGLTNWAKSKGVSEIRLDVYSDNDSAIRAYEKAGFSNLLTEMRVDIS